MFSVGTGGCCCCCWLRVRVNAVTVGAGGFVVGVGWQLMVVVGGRGWQDKRCGGRRVCSDLKCDLSHAP